MVTSPAMPQGLAHRARCDRHLLAHAVLVPVLLVPVLLVMGLAFPSEARADPCQAAPYVSTCINAENLWPHAGPQVFATVGGVDTVAVDHFAFALVTDYQSRPIVFNAPIGGGTSPAYAIDNQVNGNFLWAIGLTRRLELDFALPITFSQSGGGAAPITGSNVPLDNTAIRDFRFGFAFQLVPHTLADPQHGFGLTGRVEISAPNGDRDQYAGDATAVFSPSLAADYRAGRWFAGLELGARIRPDVQLLGEDVGPQGTIALGIGYDLLTREKLLGVMLEARSLPTFATQYDAPIPGLAPRSNSDVLAPSEWMLSLRSSPLATDDLSLTLGGGGALTSGETGFTGPRFRFLLGLRYAPVETIRKPPVSPPVPADAAPATDRAAPLPPLDLAAKPDACKGDPDSADGFKDDDGCPDEDQDKDGIDDRYDRCPLVAEDFAGLTDGCPDAPSLKPTPPSP
jgi:OmpA-OmpF porin, OOP family